MKTYRLIGSTLCAVLTPFTILILCAALLLFNVAGMITEDTIRNLTEDFMQDEQVRDTVSGYFTEELFGSGREDSPIAKESIDKIIALPSTQKLISEILASGTEELTGGEFDGTLNLSEKIRENFTENPETMTDFSDDVSNVLLEDTDFRETIKQAFLTENDGVPAIDGETLDKILQTESCRKLLSAMLSQKLSEAVGAPVPEPLNIADELADFIKNEPALADEVIDAYFPDSETFYAAVADASAYAKEVGAPQPEIGISKTDFVLYCLELYEDDCNEYFDQILGGAEVDYTASESTDANPPDGADDLVLELDEETTEMLNQLASALAFLRSTAFLLIILAFFALSYLFTALLTFSLRRPLIFSGITALLTGIALIAVTALPIPSLATEVVTDSTELITSLIASVWGSLSTGLIITGVIAIVVGILLFVSYFFLYEKKKVGKKETACVA